MATLIWLRTKCILPANFLITNIPKRKSSRHWLTCPRRPDQQMTRIAQDIVAPALLGIQAQNHPGARHAAPPQMRRGAFRAPGRLYRRLLMNASEKSLLVGIDIGGTKTAVLLSSAPPEVMARKEFATRPAQGPERALELIKSGIHEMLAEQGMDGSVIARLGVSCGGPLDRVQGII